MLYACTRLANFDTVGNGGGLEQFMDRCIWNWFPMVLEIAVMASVAAVPHTMLQPRKRALISTKEDCSLGVIEPLPALVAVLGTACPLAFLSSGSQPLTSFVYTPIYCDSVLRAGVVG